LPQPFTIRDMDFGAVRLRAFGNYNDRVADPKLFHTQISGTRAPRALLTELVSAFEGLGLKLEGMEVQNLSLPEEAFAPSHAAGRRIVIRACSC
jgi:hypothetical protein